jgi:hypothetical protein
MSISSITGSVSTYGSYGSQSVSGQGAQQNSATQSSAYSQTIDTDSLTVLSLDQNLSSQADITQNDLLAQGLAQAIDGATTVDPVTGQRELIGGASSSLTSTITNLLTENGFSQDDAEAATAALEKELAHGGKALLTLDQDSTVTSGEAAVLSNGSGSAAGAQITSSEYASRVTIGIDLNSGKLAVSTQSESNFATASKVTADGSAVGNGFGSFVGGQQGPLDGASEYILGVSSGSDVQEFLHPESAKPNPLKQLLDNLLTPTIANADPAGQAVGHLSRLANGTADAGTAFPGVTVQPNGTAQTQVDVRTPVAVRNTDHHGHGSTLYKRPDGSLGTFTLKPTNVTA